MGTYICGCREGYALSESDKKPTCVDINECTNANTCPMNGICQNSEGGHSCSCNNGYEGETCSDVDECSEDENLTTHTCNENAKCRVFQSQ